jgi:hypothetical protein
MFTRLPASYSMCSVKASCEPKLRIIGWEAHLQYMKFAII